MSSISPHYPGVSSVGFASTIYAVYVANETTSSLLLHEKIYIILKTLWVALCVEVRAVCQVLLPEVLIEFYPISYIQGKKSIKEIIVIYNSLKLDLSSVYTGYL
jgi:hypothetical protein